MNPRIHAALAAVLLLSVGPLLAADRATEEFVRRVLETQNTVGAVIRGKLSVEDPTSELAVAVQIRIRLRRDANVTRLLYQVLWPATRKGEALYLERSARGAITGFIFAPPDKTSPVNAASMARPYLESDLTVEDLAEDFLQWPAQKISGEETIGTDVCKILDSRPPAGAQSTYSLVRTWISAERLVPLRIEKFRDGRPAKRFTVQKTTRHDGTWVPVVTSVQSAGQSRETILELSRGERDVEIPLEEFALDRIRQLAPTAAPEPKE